MSMSVMALFYHQGAIGGYVTLIVTMGHDTMDVSYIMLSFVHKVHFYTQYS